MYPSQIRLKAGTACTRFTSIHVSDSIQCMAWFECLPYAATVWMKSVWSQLSFHLTKSKNYIDQSQSIKKDVANFFGAFHRYLYVLYAFGCWAMGNKLWWNLPRGPWGPGTLSIDKFLGFYFKIHRCIYA